MTLRIVGILLLTAVLIGALSLALPLQAAPFQSPIYCVRAPCGSPSPLATPRPIGNVPGSAGRKSGTIGTLKILPLEWSDAILRWKW